MKNYPKEKLRQNLNKYGKQKEPILFVIDFDIQDFCIYPMRDVPKDVLYKFENFTNAPSTSTPKENVSLSKNPMKFNAYNKYFYKIQKQIKKGNTYLLNLSFPTKVKIKSSKKNISLKKIFLNSSSKFKLLMNNKFVSFSPERFVKTKNNKIFTYPIKGTIDASINNAKTKILSDIKESAEHTMIVDLLRNDLGIISKNIKVNYFRNVEKINAGSKELLQVSSEIEGLLEEKWQEKLGDKIISLLPAGSISGTPKKKSIEIINNIEQQYKGYKRGFFCGICGYFDGKNVDSFVLIRFLEKKEDGFIYKSGGGITSDSDALKEYEEMLDKVYIPIKK